MPTDASIIPRKFTTAIPLFDQDKIFIIGGFYDQEHNYLSLQNQITGVDFSEYN